MKIKKLDRRFRTYDKGMRFRLMWDRSKDQNCTRYQQCALSRFRTAEAVAERFFGNHYMTHNNCAVTWITSSAYQRSNTEWWIDVQTENQVLLLEMADRCIVMDHSTTRLGKPEPDIRVVENL